MPEKLSPAKLQKHLPDGGISARFDLAETRIVPADFYARNVRDVAPDVLGKILVRREGRKIRAARIVEVEAYLGVEDPAAHAYSGKTKRNFVLFGPPGRAYIYFIYGNHYCLNISCEPEGRAGCVLIRALEPLAGIEQMYLARDLEEKTSRPAQRRLLTSGPGRLAEAFSITRERDNDKDVTSSKSDLQVVDDGYRPAEIACTPRIGITKAVEHPLRFVIAGNPFVSGRRVAATL